MIANGLPERKQSNRIALRRLSISVDPLTSREVIEIVKDAISARRLLVVGNHNLHSAYLSKSNPAIARYFSAADYLIIDGFPILLAASLKRGRFLGSRRVGSLDWIPQLVRAGGATRVAVVGASRTSNTLAVEAIRTAIANDCADVLGWPGDPWNWADAPDLVASLRVFGPQLVLVGLGMPLQEELLSRFKAELPAAVYATVGGAIDQLGGHQRSAPRWMGAIGVEWSWRLLTQPRRLWRRYLWEPVKLLALLMRAESRSS